MRRRTELAARPAGTIFVAALGDSITAGSPGYDPSRSNAELLGFGEDPQSQWEYWAQQRNPRVRFRNCGVFGERTTRSRAACSPARRAPDVSSSRAGQRHRAGPAGRRGGGRNLRAMVDRGKSLGLRVEVAELIPWNNGYPDASRRSAG